MSYKLNAPARLAALLTPLLLLASCATPLPILPVVPEPIRIPSPPVGATPAPSGTYLATHCALTESASKRLNKKLAMPEYCSTLGLPSPAKEK